MGKATVLYIEDNVDNMTLVRRVLEIEGYEVISAETGQDGLNKIQTNHPDIVITDINLPDIDGYEITRIIKSDTKTSHIPVVAMTANVMQKHRDNVAAAGCDGFISKPINIDELPDQVEHYLKGAA
jgi:two-component system, cell cycle response regulator DivK